MGREHPTTDGSHQQATQDPATPALRWTSPAPAQLQPTHVPAAAPASPTVPACDQDRRCRDPSAPAVPRDSSCYLCRRLRESADQAPASCRADCHPGQNVVAVKERVAFLPGDSDRPSAPGSVCSSHISDQAPLLQQRPEKPPAGHPCLPGWAPFSLNLPHPWSEPPVAAVSASQGAGQPLGPGERWMHFKCC